LPRASIRQVRGGEANRGLAGFLTSRDRNPTIAVLRRASFVCQGLWQDAAERINRVTVARQATASLNHLFDGMFLLTNAR
jgi:hypothetical protein